nr:MAG TPA: hypothetical protein [Caudoviricetes sp.]
MSPFSIAYSINTKLPMEIMVIFDLIYKLNRVSYRRDEYE